MPPGQSTQLKTHLDAIAEILYDESNPADMQTLEGIELSVREQIQAHVSPALGLFLSARLAAPQPDAADS